MTCGMHEYYLVLHVHIHITSKNGNVCKLCATERIFRLTWPQLWRHRSNVRGSGSWNFQGGRKKDKRKAIEKMVTFKRLTKKIFQKNRRGVCINPPPLCRRGLKVDQRFWYHHVCLVKPRWTIYKMTMKGQGQSLTSFQVRSRSLGDRNRS